jgi:hypothetical protein
MDVVKCPMKLSCLETVVDALMEVSMDGNIVDFSILFFLLPLWSIGLSFLSFLIGGSRWDSLDG